MRPPASTYPLNEYIVGSPFFAARPTRRLRSLPNIGVDTTVRASVPSCVLRSFRSFPHDGGNHLLASHRNRRGIDPQPRACDFDEALLRGARPVRERTQL